jgi:hypothetical protein
MKLTHRGRVVVGIIIAIVVVWLMYVVATIPPGWWLGGDLTDALG